MKPHILHLEIRNQFVFNSSASEEHGELSKISYYEFTENLSNHRTDTLYRKEVENDRTQNTKIMPDREGDRCEKVYNYRQ